MVVKYSQIRPIANEWVICKNLQIIHDAEKKCTGMKGRPSKIEHKMDICGKIEPDDSNRRLKSDKAFHFL